MPESLGSIFISYRRDDSADVAGRLYDRLADHFGERSIFKNVDSIPFGVDFREFISESVGRRKVLLAVIGPHWLTVTDERGQRRLDNPRDFVCIEIETALQRDIPIIPLFINGASMPSEQALPRTLQRLVYCNGTQLRRDPDFRRDVDRLVAALEAYLEQPPKPQGASACESALPAPNPTSASGAPPASRVTPTRTTQDAATPTTAGEYLIRGNARYAAQDYAEATENYTQAITLDPTYLIAYFNRGLAYYAQNKLDLALTDFNQVLSLEPKYPNGYNTRGEIYQAQNKLDLAMGDFTQALTLAPNYASPYYNRGLLHKRRNERDAAIADFRQARDLYLDIDDRLRQAAIEHLTELGAD